MKKETMKAIAIGAIILVLYHLFVFLIPFDKEAVFWISYGFTLAAFAVVGVAYYMTFVKNIDAKSRFYSFPITRIGVVYGIAQLVAGLVLMAVGQWITWWIVVLLYATGLGAAVIGLISAEAVVEEIHAQDVKLQKDVSLMRALQSKVGQLAAQSDDAAIKSLAEEFRYSDPVSSEACAEAEADLAAVVDELQAAVVDGDREVTANLCRRVSALLSERNRICKLNKH